MTCRSHVSRPCYLSDSIVDLLSRFQSLEIFTGKTFFEMKLPHFTEMEVETFGLLGFFCGDSATTVGKIGRR